MICPRCNGAGGNQAIFCGPGQCRSGLHPCSTCKSTGEIDEHRAAQIERGEALRKARVKRRDTQREEAKRLGIDVAVYSRMEFGIHDGPEWELIPLSHPCDCGRQVTMQGCVGCNEHPLDCSCFPVGYDHKLAEEADKLR